MTSPNDEADAADASGHTVAVSDAAEILCKTLYYTEKNGPAPHTISAGTGADTTVNHIAQTVIDVVGQGTVEHLPMRMGESAGAVVKGDPSTLEIIGFDANKMISLEDGVQRTVEYFRDYLDKKD